MSNHLIQPYLFFGGRCAEALEFYRTAIGATIGPIFRFDQSPDPVPPGMLAPGFETKIMHASFQVGSTTVMAADGCNDSKKFAAFSLSLTVPDEAAAKQAFDALAAGGAVTMPLGKTFWSPCFGMLTDRFGVDWMVTLPTLAPA